MRISIASKIRPFLRRGGSSTVLPGSTYQVQVFPGLIRVFDLRTSMPTLIQEVFLHVKGPLEQFLICNDLEKGRLTVSGKSQDGWMRYHLISSHQALGIQFFVEKTPACGLEIQMNEKSHFLFANESLPLFGSPAAFEAFQVPDCDRLSLGNHKSGDWDLIKRRFELIEILPILHRLGQLVPQTHAEKTSAGTLILLEECKENLNREAYWKRFLAGCFYEMLVPQLFDQGFQGLISSKNEIPFSISPLTILSESSHLIRSLFFLEEENHLSFLPYVLPSMHCGRMLDIPLKDGGKISLEWTKKCMRRFILISGSDCEISFKMNSSLRNCRLRHNHTDKGERISTKSSLKVEKNCQYLFDNFQ